MYCSTAMLTNDADQPSVARALAVLKLHKRCAQCYGTPCSQVKECTNLVLILRCNAQGHLHGSIKSTRLEFGISDKVMTALKLNPVNIW